MHKSEPKAYPTFIIHANKVYEFRAGTIKIHRSTNSLKIQFWSLFNIPLERINWTLVSYVNNNETLRAWIDDLLSIVFNLPMNWYL